MNSMLFRLAIVLLGIAATLSAPLGGNQGWRRGRRPQTKDEQMIYLRKFGHWRGPKNTSNATDNDLRRSVQAFQRFVGINDTGVVDNDTLEIMESRRCGLTDNNDAPGRRKRYVLFATKWNSNILSYFFQNVTTDLPADVTKAEIARAFKYWSDVTPLSISESNSSSATFRILFASGSHGDSNPFDGPGGVLAHAFIPQVGNAHFDEAENWTHASYEGTNLLQAAAHEFGHLLGLAHSSVRSALMYPYYQSYKPNFALDKDDIAGIQAIYGKPESNPTTLPTVKVPSPLLSPRSTAKTTIRTTTSTTTRPITRPTPRLTTIPTTRTTTTQRFHRCRFYESWFGWC